MESLKMLSRSFVTHFDSSKGAEPSQGSLHDVSLFAEAASFGRFHAGLAASLEQDLDAQHEERCDEMQESITSISLQHSRFPKDRAIAIRQRRSCLHQRDGFCVVSLIGRPGLNHQRNTVRVGDYMPFAAFFRSIDGIRSGVGPPFCARTLALSMISRSRLSMPWVPRAASKCSCAFVQTPAVVQRWNRRQQVLPEPTPNSAGNACQRRPSRSKNRTPVKARRSSTGGRPPFGDRFRTGKWGWIASHSSSVSNADMAGTPLPKLSCHYSQLTGF